MNDDFWIQELATQQPQSTQRDVGSFGVYLSWTVLAVVAVTSLGALIASLI